MKTRMKFATLAILSAMAVVGTTNQVWADKGGQQQVELRARANKHINGFEAELRGDYRERPGRDRLNAELEQINIPAGTPVAFCLVQGGVSSLIGVANVSKAFQTEIELEAENGDVVPTVKSGNLLEAHQTTKAPFSTNPTCSDALLISAPFTK